MDSVLIAKECLDSCQQSRILGILWQLIGRIRYTYGKYVGLEKYGGNIQFCISTIRFSVFINGTPNGFFDSGRGLCQGDPPPLFFVMVIEAFSRLIVGGCIDSFAIYNRNNETLVISAFVICRRYFDFIIFLYRCQSDLSFKMCFVVFYCYYWSQDKLDSILYDDIYESFG